jgi:S-formylglutathione hydrolase
MTSLITRKEHSCFGGKVIYYSHQSQTCNCPMNFAVYLPPVIDVKPLPVIYYLSGLTCSEENFTVKAGAQLLAAKYGIMLVVPDTSPRQTGIVGEDETWDLGSGASFYVDATIEPWRQHYQMYSYIVKELPEVIASNFTIDPTKQSIFGHSMGGHGALICALKNPDLYRSVSAFAPICAPIQCSLGEKAFATYLGKNLDLWQQYDATELAKISSFKTPILITQGMADEFYQQQYLLPELFVSACNSSQIAIDLRLQEGYDHSYFTIATFIAEHFEHHAKYLEIKPIF